jgi:hypothetical protein
MDKASVIIWLKFISLTLTKSDLNKKLTLYS